MTKESLVHGEHVPNKEHEICREENLAIALEIRYKPIQPRYPKYPDATYFIGYYKRYYNWIRGLRQALIDAKNIDPSNLITIPLHREFKYEVSDKPMLDHNAMAHAFIQNPS